MDLFLKGIFGESACDNMFSPQDIQRCPFLRNINEPTSFNFSSSVKFPSPVRGVKGPIFEDGPSFETAFKLFHGQDGVVPLSGESYMHNENPEPNPGLQFNPLAVNAASISLSAFGPEGPFGFNFFSRKWKKHNKNSSKPNNVSQKRGGSSHEAQSSEWLESGQCPIAKSYRAVNRILPLVAKALQPPPGIKVKCPPAIVAARAALARTALVKNLRPQPLPSKMFAIALLGMAANVPLGAWREHTDKFSPQWFVAVHAAVPFIAMLRKSVLMPKTAMAFTIAASILGQTIGSRAERLRLKAERGTSGGSDKKAVVVVVNKSAGHTEIGMAWEPLPMKAGGAVTTNSAPTPPATSAANVCY